MSQKLLKVGDIVHKGEEIANLEAMKMENAIIAPFDGQIADVCSGSTSLYRKGSSSLCSKRYRARSRIHQRGLIN